MYLTKAVGALTIISLTIMLLPSIIATSDMEDYHKLVNLKQHDFHQEDYKTFINQHELRNPLDEVITDCNANVTAPGIYTLESDLNCTTQYGVRIFTNNVTLDCQGHTIYGTHATGQRSILVLANESTVRNCIIADSDVSIGVQGNHNHVSNNIILSEGIGIWLSNYNEEGDDAIYGNSAIGNTVEGGTFGILLEGSHDATVNSNTLQNIWFPILVGFMDNFWWATPSENNIITSNNISNTLTGIILESDSSGSIVNRNAILNCEQTGMAIGPNVSHSVIENNTVYRCGDYGLKVGLQFAQAPPSYGNNITGNRFCSNNMSDIYNFQVGDNLFIDNVCDFDFPEGIGDCTPCITRRMPPDPLPVYN